MGVNPNHPGPPRRPEAPAGAGRKTYSRFGWDLAGDGKTLTPNPAEQEAIAWILQWRANGKSMNWIAGELDRRGVATKGRGRKGRGGAKAPEGQRAGKPWSRTSVALVISRHALPEPQWDPAAAVPLTELRDRIVSGYESSKCSYSHIRMVRRVFRVLSGFEGVRTTADLSPTVVTRFLDSFPRSTEATRQTYLGVLKTICRIGVEGGYMPADPSRGRLVTRRKPRDRKLSRSREEVRRVLAHLKQGSGKKGEARWKESRLYALAATVVYTGLHPVEALSLAVDDVDLEHRSIRVTRRGSFKSGPLRMEPSVYIPVELLPILTAWLPETGGRWLFPNGRRTARWNTSGYVRAVRAAGEACGTPGLSLQSLHRFHGEHIKAAFRLEDVPADGPRASQVPKAANDPADLGHPAPRPAAGRGPGKGPEWDGRPRDHLLVLGGPDDLPVVLGVKLKAPLKTKQYLVAKAILDAGPEGLPSLEALIKTSGCGGARLILKALSEPELLGAVLRVQKVRGGGNIRFDFPDKT